MCHLNLEWDFFSVWLIGRLFLAYGQAGRLPSSRLLPPILARGCAPSFAWVFFDRFSHCANILYCSCAQRPPVDSHCEPHLVSE